MKNKTQLKLVKTSKGRIFLHVSALIKDHLYSWHMDGIIRELKGIYSR